MPSQSRRTSCVMAMMLTGSARMKLHFTSSSRSDERRDKDMGKWSRRLSEARMSERKLNFQTSAGMDVSFMPLMSSVRVEKAGQIFPMYSMINAHPLIEMAGSGCIIRAKSNSRPPLPPTRQGAAGCSVQGTPCRGLCSRFKRLSFGRSNWQLGQGPI